MEAYLTYEPHAESAHASNTRHEEKASTRNYEAPEIIKTPPHNTSELTAVSEQAEGKVNSPNPQSMTQPFLPGNDIKINAADSGSTSEGRLSPVSAFFTSGKSAKLDKRASARPKSESPKAKDYTKLLETLRPRTSAIESAKTSLQTHLITEASTRRTPEQESLREVFTTTLTSLSALRQQGLHSHQSHEKTSMLQFKKHGCQVLTTARNSFISNIACRDRLNSALTEWLASFQEPPAKKEAEEQKFNQVECSHMAETALFGHEQRINILTNLIEELKTESRKGACKHTMNALTCSLVAVALAKEEKAKPHLNQEQRRAVI